MWSVAADADAPPPSAASPIKASSSRPKKRIGWIAAPVIRRAMAAKYWESFTKSGRHFGRPALLGLSSSGEHRRQIFGERRVVEIVLGQVIGEGHAAASVVMRIGQPVVRKSVVLGKSVSVCVELGGGGNI